MDTTPEAGRGTRIKRMSKEIPGIHHVTAIAGEPQRNIDFYVRLLGLRLVKKTVNFDDPGTYHFYYGDEIGSAGTILTFFPWPGARQGRKGTGQSTSVAFSIPQGSVAYWQQRLVNAGIEVEEAQERFGEQIVTFGDPDGLQIELVAGGKGDARAGWPGGAVPAEFGIKGVHSVTLSEESYERTASMLRDILGFRLVGAQGNRFRYETGEGGAGATVDLLDLPGQRRGIVAVGTIHHVAYRALSDEAQAAWREEIAARGYSVTPVLDREYFHSIYFREPGGVLFEIATDPPGFLIDEAPDELGTHLKLPPWYEAERNEIERVLPEIHLPSS